MTIEAAEVSVSLRVRAKVAPSRLTRPSSPSPQTRQGREEETNGKRERGEKGRGGGEEEEEESSRKKGGGDGEDE